MDFDKLYDMFCEYYKDDGSNDEIMKGRIEKAFLKYAQTIVKNCSISDVILQSEQLQAVEDLKDLCYDVCPLDRRDDLSEIVYRL